MYKSPDEDTKGIEMLSKLIQNIYYNTVYKYCKIDLINKLKISTLKYFKSNPIFLNHV